MRARTPALAALLVVIAAVTGACAALDASERPPASLPVAELLLVGFSGTAVADNEEVRRLVCDVKVGGVILFERDVATGQPRNIESAEQVKKLTADLQTLARECAGRPLFIAADAEGGQVMRLSARLGYLPSLSPHELGMSGDVTLTELEARRIGRMLRAAGINWDLAPVVDVGYNPANPVVVGTARSFSANPRLVAEHARAFVLGMRAEGVLTALKHFPGHGSSYGDSHRGFTDVTDTAAPEVELLPYRTLIDAGLADSVMTAHVFNRRLDGRRPATLSRATISGLLRGELGFAGPVVSDDLRMAAIEQQYGLGEAAVLAIDAGVDMLLIVDNRLPDGGSAALVTLGAIRDALASGTLDPARVEAALARIRAFRGRLP